MVDDAGARQRIRLLAEIAPAVRRGLRPTLGHVDHVPVAQIEPLHRELEVRSMSARKAEDTLVPVAGLLDICRLHQEMLEIAEWHDSLGALPDLELKGPDTVDAALQHVAALYGAHAGGSPCVDQISGRQGEQGREVSDHFGDLPDQLRDVAALPDLAVHLQPDRAAGRVADAGCRRDAAAWRRAIEALAGVPRPRCLLCRGLQIAARHVEPDRVA